MRCLAIDSVTADVAERFREAGIRTLLLKGASIAQWLYRDGETRTYGDVDLLISPDRFDHAEKILEENGFRHLLAGATPDEMTSTHSWLSPGEEKVMVELHRTFHHIGAPDEDLWKEFTLSTETILVAGYELEMPAEVARCLIVALHVGHHGKEFSWPLRDLALAVDRVSIDTWIAAVSVARRLEAVPAMVAGLRVIEPGQELCRKLDLSALVPTTLFIEAENIPLVMNDLERLAAVTGLRGKIGFAMRKLFPTRSWMRYRYHAIDGSGIRLLATYIYRLTAFFIRSPSILLTWRKVRQRAARANAR